MSDAQNKQYIIAEAVQILQQGGVILYPTETVWGLGCSATSAAAIERLYKIKNRRIDKKMISLIAEAKDIFTYVSSPPPDILEIMQSFERPTSMVFDDVVGLSPLLLDEGRGALRVAANDVSKSLIKQSAAPLVSTSANVSMELTPLSFEDVSDDIKQQVDYILSPDLICTPMTGAPSDLVYISAAGDIEPLMR